MTQDTALQWIAFATQQPIGAIMSWGLEPAQIVTLGQTLAANPLINPPTKRPMKQADIVCACGCGETFRATYRTKKPKYKNAAHKARAYRRRRRERELAAIEAARPRAAALVRNERGGFKVLHAVGV